MCLSCSGAFCNNPSMLLNTLTSSFLNLFFASFAPIVISNPSTGALFTIFAKFNISCKCNIYVSISSSFNSMNPLSN